MLKKHHEFLLSIFLIGDIIIISASWLAAYYLRFSSFWWNDYTGNPLSHDYFLLLIASLFLFPFIFKNMGLYKPRRTSTILAEEFDVLKASTLAILILIAASYLLKKDSYSRLVFLYFSIFSIILLILERFILREFLRFFRSKGYNRRRVLIIGAGELGEKVSKRIKESSWTGLEIAGFLDDSMDVGASIQGAKILGKIRDINKITSEYDIDQVFITLPAKAYRKIMYVVENLRDEVISVRIVPDIYQAVTLYGGIEEFNGLPIINLTDSKMYGWNVIVKRVADVAFSSLALALLSPIMLTIALIIKLTSRGPVIFKQKRYGLDGKEIKVYKFRSMSVCEDGPNVPQARKGDTRITAVGSFLRRTSLDELPQFLNVLQGRMSVVGPRPHAVSHNEEYRKLVKSYMLRHKVKPGITGWAQVNGWRGETDTLDKMEKRVECDLFYIENYSCWLDMKIVWLTIWNGFIHKHAY